MSFNEFEKYENQVIDVDSIEGTDLKINPDYYIHRALVKAQDCLTKENVREGFLQFRVIISHIESMCKAAHILTDDYYKKVEEYKKENDYKEEKDDNTKSVKLANKKLELMMQEVFSSKTITDSLKA